MANEYTIGQKISGIGAALSGQVPQFQQQMEQLDEKRTEAMYKDAGAAYQLLGNNDYQGIINLANDRLGLLQRLPGSDPSDTMQVLQLAQGAAAGNTQSLSQLTQVLESANQQGLARGYYTAPAGPEEYTLGQGDIRFRGGEEIARGMDRPTGQILSDDAARRLGLDPNKTWQRSTTGQVTEVGGSGVNINTGDAQDDPRKLLFAKYVEEIPEQSRTAYSQIALANEAQTIADLMEGADESLFKRGFNSIFPDMAVAFDQEGFRTAAQAIANRLAPTMREEGSGSTSDGEMKQYLRSLPDLMSTSNGRQLTAQIFQAKADIEKKRLDAYDDYINEKINQKELLNKIREIDRSPLFSDERKAQINNIVPGFFRDTPQMQFNPPSGITLATPGSTE